MVDFLTTTPRYDDVTFYLQQWTLEVMEEARKKGKNTLHLNEGEVTKTKFEKTIRKHKPKFILINGHGSEREIAGQGNIRRREDGSAFSDEIILEVGDNEDITSGSIVYARACSSSAQLGKACVEKGAIAYMGYKGRFVFFVDGNKATRRKEDKIANYFKEITNSVPLTILKGNTTSDAVERSKLATIKTIERLESSEYNDAEAQAILPFLYLDLVFLDLQGNASAKI